MMNYEPSQRAKALLELRKREGKLQPPPLAPALSDAYTFHGSNLDMVNASETEVLMSGAAGTGKSLACLTKLHRIARDWPGARCLMVRKTRVSLTNAALVTFEQHVLGLGHPLTNGASRGHRNSYMYPNGSEIAMGGMDNPTRIMSTEWDVVYVQEAIELDQVDLESLKTRLRNGKVPVQQLIMDTNPDNPMHWLKQRSDNGLTRMIYCHHEDNPILYNVETGEWTERGKAYITNLDSLTGVLKERLRFGKWVQSEGVIYDNFDPEFNVSEDAEYNPDWEVIWGVDDGYTEGAGIGTEGYHPRVVLFGQVTPQGGVNIFREYTKTHELSENTIENVLSMPYRRPRIVYVDSSASELIQRLRNAPLTTFEGTHKVSEGIKNLRRLVCDGHGVRLLKIHPRCKNLIREFLSYHYNPNFTGVNAGEPAPLKIDDHHVDSARYMAWPLRYKQ